MPILDLAIVAIVLGGVAWGYRQGLSTGAFALAGFAVGAILGSRVAPLILDGGLEDPFAPVVSLPAALLLGAALAAIFERLGFRLRLRLRRRSTADVVGGALLAGCVGVVGVWIAGTVAAQVDSLKGTVRDSAIIDRLNATLPPPGPLLSPTKPPVDPLPTLVGPEPNVGPADPTIRRDPQVRRTASSVVKVFVSACDRIVGGTGWIGRDGVVVTNAHIVEGSESGQVEVKLRGKGPSHSAETIWYDDLNDLALLRVTSLEGVPKLRLKDTLAPGTYVAALGFPGAGAFRITPGRMGNNARIPEEDRTVTVMRASGAGPGSSGSPAVDRHGRVVTTLSSGRAGGRSVYGVPARIILRALQRAGPPVSAGSCLG